MLIGIRSTATSKAFSEGKLCEIKSYGFNAVELSFGRDIELDYQNINMAYKTRKEAEKYGLSLTAHLPDNLDLCAIDSRELSRNLELLCEMLNGFYHYGVLSAVIHAEGDCQFYNPVNKDFVKMRRNSLFYSLCILSDTCEKLKIPLLVETMPPGYAITSDLNEILQLIIKVNSPFIGICIDVNHLNLSEALAPAILSAKQYLGEIHCSDNYGTNENHLMLYDGVIDWQVIAKTIADIKFSGALILETNTFDAEKHTCLLGAAAYNAKRLHNDIVKYSNG